MTAEEFATFVRDAEELHVPLFGGAPFDPLRGAIRHDVADGVVSLLAGTSLVELNAVLAADGRCIPYVPVWPSMDLSIGSLILLGLPHAGESYGSWRDWILGATMATAEGHIVRSGSRVVKSVAGYDAHKLLVGSRGTLLLPIELTLRTFPAASAGFPHDVQSLGEKVQSIGRVRRTDLPDLLKSLDAGALWTDEDSSTVWSDRSVQDWPCVPYGWAIDPLCPVLPIESLTLMKRAKAVLDPIGKLAPGAFHNL